MGVADIIYVQLLLSIAQGNVEKEYRLPVGPVMDRDSYCILCRDSSHWGFIIILKPNKGMATSVNIIFACTTIQFCYDRKHISIFQPCIFRYSLRLVQWWTNYRSHCNFTRRCQNLKNSYVHKKQKKDLSKDENSKEDHLTQVHLTQLLLHRWLGNNIYEDTT